MYFGSDVFLSCFEYLVEREEILALYTYHNDEDYFNEYNIVSMAKELGIPVHYEAIGQERIRQFFKEEGCDLFFIAEYDKKIDIPEDLAVCVTEIAFVELAELLERHVTRHTQHDFACFALDYDRKAGK